MGLAAGLVLMLTPLAATAQLLPLSGYYLHAAAAAEASPLGPSGALDLQRLRLMSRGTAGPVRFQVAWETTLLLRSDAVVLGRGFQEAEPAAPWLNLQGSLVDRRRVGWVHGLDRLSLSHDVGSRARITVGRQTVSWATTLYFTPGDPFVPFDPADPFREYRAGVDALRGVVFTGPFSEVDAVVRPAPAPGGGESWTALLRGQRLVEGWELSAWGGLLHDRGAAALAASGSVGELGIRAEGTVRSTESGTVVRMAAGVDRLLEFRERDLRIVAEVQRDGFGARDADQLAEVALSLPAARGELSVLGRHAALVNATWQVHPLASASLLSLVSLRDGSALVSPGLTWSLADEVSLRLGAYAGLGPGARTNTHLPQLPPGGQFPGLRSEHGATPLIGFAALSVFF
ncbi:MAG: hypothetical protein EA422_12320 [Gemmatimonadales bacterium]|nr:MAG: hypothetical protein EA422_12320 [Gemmatimonadales bacterium]